MKLKLCILMLITAALLAGCQQADIVENPTISSREWNLITESAEATVVTLYYASSEQGFEKWLTREVAPSMRSSYGIELKTEKKPMAEILKKLKENKAMEVEDGTVDMIYIDDASFKELMESGLLYGPFVEKLPNYYSNIHPEDYEFFYEEGMASEGHFMPVAREQLAFVYDEDMIVDPPQTMKTFIETLRTAPGQFSFPLPPEKSGTLFMETFIAAYVDYEKLYMAQPDRAIIEPMLEPALEALATVRPKLWKEGMIFAADENHLDQLFYDGKVSFALTTTSNKPSQLAKAEVYPYAARAFVIDEGTAGRNGGIVIAYNAPNKSGAMVVANHMISAQSQLFVYDPSKWGCIPVVDTSVMPEAEAALIKSVSIRRSDMKQDALNSHRVPAMPSAIRAVVTEIWLEALGAEQE